MKISEIIFKKESSPKVILNNPMVIYRKIRVIYSLTDSTEDDNKIKFFYNFLEKPLVIRRSEMTEMDKTRTINTIDEKKAEYTPPYELFVITPQSSYFIREFKIEKHKYYEILETIPERKGKKTNNKDKESSIRVKRTKDGFRVTFDLKSEKPININGDLLKWRSTY